MKILSKFSAKHYQIATILVLGASIAMLSGLIDGAYESYGPAATKFLKTINKKNYALAEISGAHIQGDSAVIIGDTKATIGKISLDKGKLGAIENIEFSEAILQQFAVCDSTQINECRKQKELLTGQWEAISSDASGRYFLLNEQLSTIFIYNHATKKVDALINLQGFAINKEQEKEELKKQENALAEGLLLLNNGHILILKERFPPSIIEFGAEGEKPQGYNSAMRLKKEEKFTVSAGRTTFKALKSWLIPHDFQACDLSELASDTSGGIFVMSQKCHWISRIGELKLSDNELSFADIFSLPLEIKNPEALAVIDANTFLVGSDSKSMKKDNVFVVQEVK